jgi:large subunit ribosomal protein L23
MKQTIIKPVLTEKATDGAVRQVYMFQVGAEANKHQVQQSLETMYGVKVKHVRMVNRKGKTRRVARRSNTVQMPDRRIAYVTLISGKFDMFPQA